MSELQLRDTDKLQLHGDIGNWKTVGEMRRLGYTEEELEVAAEWGTIERHGSGYTIRELRTAESAASVEQLRAFEREIGRRVGSAVTILSMNANLGTGTYQVVASHGQTVSKPFTFTGSTITTPTFAKPINAGGPLKGEESKLTPSPDPYAKELSERRAASATTEPNFEDQWKEQRAAEFSAQRDRMTAHVAAHPSAPRLTTAELRSYAPPDPYAAGIAKMRKEDR